MGLAEAGAAVNEERVVAGLRFPGHRLAGRMGELVVGPDHEAAEGVERVEADGLEPLFEGLALSMVRPR